MSGHDLHASPRMGGRCSQPQRSELQSSCGWSALRGAPHTGEPARLGLTPREYELLRLITAGQANAATAAQLFISAMTVSVHVSSILGKLGVASRGEAAALAHRMRLFDDAQPVTPG